MVPLMAGRTHRASIGDSSPSYALSLPVTGVSKAATAATRSAASTSSPLTTTRLLLLYVQTVLSVELDRLEHFKPSQSDKCT